jgi:hypothetical protein
MKDTILSTDREPIQWPLEIPARTKLCIYTGEADIGEWGLIRPAGPSLSRPSLHPQFRLFVKPATGKSMYSKEHDLVTRLVNATRELRDPIRKAVAEMRQED